MLDELITEARGWLADIRQPNMLPVMDTIVLVDRLYDGGWAAFVAADPTMIPSIVWLLMVRRLGLEFANRMMPQEVATV